MINPHVLLQHWSLYPQCWLNSDLLTPYINFSWGIEGCYSIQSTLPRKSAPASHTHTHAQTHGWHLDLSCTCRISDLQVTGRMDPSILCSRHFYIFWMILCRNLSENCEHSNQDANSYSLSWLLYITSVYIHSVILEPPGGSVAVCVHDKIVISCAVSSSPTLWWTLTDVKNASIFEQEAYTSSSSFKQEKMLGDLVLRLKSNSPLVSTATYVERHRP